MMLKKGETLSTTLSKTTLVLSIHTTQTALLIHQYFAHMVGIAKTQIKINWPGRGIARVIFNKSLVIYMLLQLG